MTTNLGQPPGIIGIKMLFIQVRRCVHKEENLSFVQIGGDDLKLKAWDIRQGFVQPMFINRRFEAGVTTIQSHPFVEHLIAVGRSEVTASSKLIFILCLVMTTQSDCSTCANLQVLLHQ